MRLRVSSLSILCCFLAMSAPAWAKTLSTHIDIDHVTKLANLDLKPGRYRLVADEANGQLKVFRDGKLVGEAKGEWVKLNRKSEYSEILMTRHVIQEVRFSGKNEAVKISS